MMISNSLATPARNDSFRKSLESVRRRSVEAMMTPEMQTKLQSLPAGSGKSTPDLLDAIRDNAESFGKTSTLARDVQRSLRSIAVAACNSTASSQHASAAGSPAHSFAETKTSPEHSSPSTPLGSARKAHPFADADRSPASTGTIHPHGHPLTPAAPSAPPAQTQAQPQAGGSYVHYGIPRHRNASQLQSRPRSRFSLEAAAEGHADVPKASRSLDIGYCPLPKKHSRCSLLYHDSIKEEEQESDSPMTLTVTATAASGNAAQHAHTAGCHGVAKSDPFEARLPSIKCHQGGRACQSKLSDRRASAERDLSVMASLRRMFTSCGRPSVLPSTM